MSQLQLKQKWRPVRFCILKLCQNSNRLIKLGWGEAVAVLEENFSRHHWNNDNEYEADTRGQSNPKWYWKISAFLLKKWMPTLSIFFFNFLFYHILLLFLKLSLDQLVLPVVWYEPQNQMSCWLVRPAVKPWYLLSGSIHCIHIRPDVGFIKMTSGGDLAEKTKVCGRCSDCKDGQLQLPAVSTADGCIANALPLLAPSLSLLRSKLDQFPWLSQYDAFISFPNTWEQWR